MLSDKEVNELVCKYVAGGRKDKKKYIDLIMRSSMASDMMRNNKYDALVDCLILSNGGKGILDKFDPEKSTETGFCGFFRRSVENRFNTNIKSESKHNKNLSLDSPKYKDENENERNLMDELPVNDTEYDAIDKIGLTDGYVSAIKIMLSKRKEGSTKIAWEKLFSTEFISQSISEKNKVAEYIIENEKRYIPVVEIPFADSYFLNGCKSISDMSKSELKPMSDFGKNNDEPCGYPLIGAVFAKYTDKSEAAVTQQKKIYEENLRKIFSI